MNNLKQALQLDLFGELEALPNEFEEYEHSKEYEKTIEKLFDKMRGDKWHSLTKKASVLILIAAILFTMMIVGFAATRGRDFIVTVFRDRYEYNVSGQGDKKKVKKLELRYIPEGFELENKSGDNFTFLYRRYSLGELYFDIDKNMINTVVGYDSQEPIEQIEESGVTYVCYAYSEYGTCGIVWNNNGYVYSLQGNISKDELLKIAKETY